MKKDNSYEKSSSLLLNFPTKAFQLVGTLEPSQFCWCVFLGWSSHLASKVPLSNYFCLKRLNFSQHSGIISRIPEQLPWTIQCGFYHSACMNNEPIVFPNLNASAGCYRWVPPGTLTSWLKFWFIEVSFVPGQEVQWLFQNKSYCYQFKGRVLLGILGQNKIGAQWIVSLEAWGETTFP